MPAAIRVHLRPGRAIDTMHLLHESSLRFMACVAPVERSEVGPGALAGKPVWASVSRISAETFRPYL